ncbi:MAG: TlpA family protein disulfide reductase [Acidobacteriia bacterium]|nr:TlpA family protein disulfide reductase [Terriglobia bacterium]
MSTIRLLAIASLAFVGAATLSTTGCSNTSAAAVKPEKDRKVAPDFTLKDANGNLVKLSDYRGKVVLLNFWATWCGPCKIEIPWFIDFQQQYRDRDFAILGVSFDDDGWKSVKPYIEQKKINYRVMIGTEELSTLYGGIDSLPTTFLIDRTGRVAKMHMGLVGKDEYQSEIQDLLNGKQPAKAGSLLSPGRFAFIRAE